MVAQMDSVLRDRRFGEGNLPTNEMPINICCTYTIYSSMFDTTYIPEKAFLSNGSSHLLGTNFTHRVITSYPIREEDC